MSMDKIEADFHDVKPEYVKKLKQMEKGRTISQAEFEKKFSVKF